MIDWAAFVVVAVTSLVSAAVVVTSYALGLRLVSGKHRNSRLARLAGTTCFVFCGMAVLFGIYLVIPALH